MRASVFILCLLIAGEAHAAFGLHLGGHFGYGSMGSDAKDGYKSRAVGSFGLQALPGFRLDSLLLGPLLDLRFIGQFEDSPATTNNNPIIDFGGRSFSLGLGASYKISMIKFLASYDFIARHYYSPEAGLKGSGWHFLLGYLYAPNAALDIQYTSSTYNALDQNDSENGLGTNSIHHGDFAIGLNWEF